MPVIEEMAAAIGARPGAGRHPGGGAFGLRGPEGRWPLDRSGGPAAAGDGGAVRRALRLDGGGFNEGRRRAAPLLEDS
jgi:hypothetical protein